MDGNFSKLWIPLPLQAAIAALVLTLLPGSDVAAAVPAPWPVRVVVMTTFEVGSDKGDVPGELQLWAEREKLTETIGFRGGPHPLLTNKDHSIVVMLTGMSYVNSGASMMALAFDKRFDVRKAYWVLAGIAGANPYSISLGSASWADYVINDFAASIDTREVPHDWPYGVLPLFADRPNTLPKGETRFGPDASFPEIFPLNVGLARWARNLTKDVPLVLTPEMSAEERLWKGFPNAQKPPSVVVGGDLSSNYFWHGTALTKWAIDWTKLFGGGRTEFVMVNTEDAAIAEAMYRLSNIGAADGQRLLLLRTASNYTMPHPGQTSVQSLHTPFLNEGRPAYEAAYRVGSRVVHEIADHWDRYRDRTPSAK